MIQKLRRRWARGQALPEFALVLPILLVVLLIAVDFGRLFYGWVNINNAARIAASYAAAEPTPVDGFGAGSEYETVVRNETNSSNCTVATVSQPTFAPDTDVGANATVSLSCSFKLFTPFIGKIVGDPMTLSATSIFMVRGGTVAGIPISSTAPGVSPGPSASASPSPSASVAPTPTPTPACPGSQINVPNLVGLTVGNARTAWASAGFTGSFTPTAAQGFDSTTVTDQVPAVGVCKPKNTSMVVQHT